MPHPVGTSTAVPRARRGPAGPLALGVGIVLVALNLRGPIVAPSAVIAAVQADLGVSGTVAGLLTSLPVLCFAVATPPSSYLIGRVGLERSVLVALALIGAGTLVRPAAGVPVALVGTVLIGVGITIGNVAIPVVVGRDFPERSSAVLGAYTAALNVGSMITLSLTVPVAGTLGWRGALAGWTVLVVVAVVGWTLGTRGRSTPRVATGASSPATGPPWWRRGTVWALLVGFGGQSFAYYGLSAWLPEILTALRGLDPVAAGLGASLFQILGLVGALVVPVIRSRTDSLRTAFAVVAVGFLALPVGLLLLPGGWPVWCALGGAAQGGGFVVMVSAMLARSHDVVDSRRVSAAVQGGGYLIGAAGPTVVGAVQEATGSWTWPLGVATVALLVLTAGGTVGTRRIRRPEPAA